MTTRKGASRLDEIPGWRLDADLPGAGGFRAIQLTHPGSTDGLQLVVDDISSARADLAAHGVNVSEIFHDAGGVLHHAGLESRVAGRAPEGKSYGSFASFSDPDGNTWFLQEVTTRLPGRE